MRALRLGVNIDHVATVRQARGTLYPDPLHAVMLAEAAGADGITLHLREDRRHIQDRDLLLLKELCQTRINLEMAITDEMLTMAERVRPQACCLVPEKREELTTEGGLDLLTHRSHVAQACQRLAASGIEVSLFINADLAQIEAAHACGAPVVELHTGHYAEAATAKAQLAEFNKIQQAASYAHSLGLQVNAGHGLHYHNVEPLLDIAELVELNIGHSIIARAVLVGMKQAVSEMKALLIR
jgi:pyridoxine 5-phosphate synthase